MFRTCRTLREQWTSTPQRSLWAERWAVAPHRILAIDIVLFLSTFFKFVYSFYRPTFAEYDCHAQHMRGFLVSHPAYPWLGYPVRALRENFCEYWVCTAEVTSSNHLSTVGIECCHMTTHALSLHILFISSSERRTAMRLMSGFIAYFLCFPTSWRRLSSPRALLLLTR